jgi:HlyD family secretion protein
MSRRLGSAMVLFSAAVLIGSCTGRGSGKEISASGTIEATEMNVASKVTGYVDKLLVDEGSRVKPGDLLVQLEHQNYDLQLAQAQAGLDLAEAQLNLALKGARIEDISQAEQALKLSEASLKQAADDKEHVNKLFKEGTYTRKMKLDADTRYNVVLAQYNQAKQNLAKVRNISRPEEIDAAKARVDQAKATVDLIKRQVSDCSIASQVDGIVTHKLINPGELVTPGGALFTISELDTVKLMIYVTEKELGRVKIGQAANVFIDTYPGRAFPGRVIYVSPVAEFTPKNIQTKDERVKLVFGVKIEIKNPEGILKPGLPADAAVKTE